MLRTRALALGARLVAPEALMGMYEVNEMADMQDVDIEVDETGTIIQ